MSQTIDEQLDQLVLVGFRIKESLRRKIKMEAAARGISVQEVLERIVTERLEKSEVKNPYVATED